MILYEYRGNDDACAPSPRETLIRVRFGIRKGECQQIFRVGGGGRRHTSINSNMTFDVALVTLIQNTSL